MLALFSRGDYYASVQKEKTDALTPVFSIQRFAKLEDGTSGIVLVDKPFIAAVAGCVKDPFGAFKLYG